MDNENNKFIDELEKWIDNRKKDKEYATNQFDKLIVYLSSGGLVFTTGFVTNIIKITDKTNTSLLKVTWILFAFALIINLFSHIASFKANDLDIKITRTKINKIKKGEYENEWRFIYISYVPMQIPIKYQDYTKYLLLIDRFLHYDITEIEEITLGYKFLFEENYNKNDSEIFFMTSNNLKIELLDFLIQNRIKTKLVDITQTSKFELDKKPISIIKHSNNQYIINMK